MKIALSSILAGVVFLVLPQAHAGRPYCWESILTPPNGSKVPANLPAVSLALGRNYNFGPAKPDLSLLDTDGNPVATSKEIKGDMVVLRPETSLAVGQTYSLSYLSPCGPADAPDVPATSHFVTVPTTPLPQNLGILKVGKVVRGAVSVALEDSVTVFDGAYVDVQVETTPDFVAFAPLATVSALVDGKRGNLISKRGTTESPSFRVTIACGPTSVALTPALGEGEHTIQVSASILGAASSLPPVEASFTLTCTDKPDGGRVSVPANPPDAASPSSTATPTNADASGPSPAPTSTNVDANSPSTAPTPSNQDVVSSAEPTDAQDTSGRIKSKVGCSCRLVGGSDGGLRFLTVAFACLWAARRRRGR